MSGQSKDSSVSDLLDRTKREPKTGIDCRKPYIVPSESSSIEELVSSTASLTHDHIAPKHTYEKSEVVPKPVANVTYMGMEHKEGCPKKKNRMASIPRSNSLISAVEPEKFKKKCPVHGKDAASTTGQPSINGVNLMELISKALEDELASL